MATLDLLRVEDLDEVEKMEQTLFGSSAWSRQMLEEELQNNDYSFYFAVREEGQIIGYCGVMILYENAEILSIGVLQPYQRHGYAKMMMQAMINLAVKLGAQSMSLEVRLSNHAAQMLYQQFGFEKVAIRSRYYADGEDAILMIKGLEA